MKKLIFWLPALIWMGVIFYLSSRTPSDLQSMFPFLENFNIGHVISYFVLGLLFLFALVKSGFSRGKTVNLLVLALCLLYGLSDEFHQYFVPGRSPDPLDIFNDMLGAAISLLLGRLLFR